MYTVFTLYTYNFHLSFHFIEEFKRAVLIATGNALGDHIVNTVFQLFDIDGELHVGCIMYRCKKSICCLRK